MWLVEHQAASLLPHSAHHVQDVELRSDKPVYLRKKLSRKFPYPTRQATGGHIRYQDESEVDSSFISRGTKAYNSIPDDMKKISTLLTFKKKLKSWTIQNISIE